MKINNTFSQFLLIKYHLTPSESKICAEKGRECNVYIFGNFYNKNFLHPFKNEFDSLVL